MEATMQDKYIQAGVENEKYAIRISDIQEIIKMQEITKIAHLGQHVKGVINLRGSVIPVISLRTALGIEEGEFGKSTRIIVINQGQEKAGLIVDCVDHVTTFNNIQAPPKSAGDVESNYLEGIGTTEKGLVGVLNIEEVLKSL